MKYLHQYCKEYKRGTDEHQSIIVDKLFYISRYQCTAFKALHKHKIKDSSYRNTTENTYLSRQITTEMESENKT